MDGVEVVLANNDRVTLRVGTVFLKVDSDEGRRQSEIAAIESAPVPTPKILWHEAPVLALEEVRGRPLGRLGEPSTASVEAWTAVGAAIRALHESPLPSKPGRSVDELRDRLAGACEWLKANDVLPIAVIEANRLLAEKVLRRWNPVHVHGDLHIEHVFVDGDEVTGIIDWSEARQGDALFDLASLTLANEARLDDLLAGYGSPVDRSIIRAWWAWRCLVVIPWLFENGYGDPQTFPETAVLLSQA